MLRFLTAGETHGQQLTVILEGMPSGLKVSLERINNHLKRRQKGYGRGARMTIENDRVQLVSGVRGGITLGSPITLIVENKDWANWSSIMNPGPEADLLKKCVTKPRPGHVDLAGAVKYHHDDLRNVLERSSARETAARVALGALVWQFLEELGIRVVSHVTGIGNARVETELSWSEIADKAPYSEVFCADKKAGRQMIENIEAAKEAGDTLGGIFEIRITNLPPGLGSYVHWERKLDGQLAQALMSIQAIKGVEIGLGFEAAGHLGSQVHDAIYYNSSRGFFRQTNGAGGLEGGVTNGEVLILRAAMKPIPTLMRPLPSVDLKTKKLFEAATERSDVCAVPAASVVGEAVIAPVLANAILEKFGADNMTEINVAWNHYLNYVRGI